MNSDKVHYCLKDFNQVYWGKVQTGKRVQQWKEAYGRLLPQHHADV